jgi:uncharacterized protein (DUF2236 family)
MYRIPPMDDARAMGELVTADSIRRVRSHVRHQVRRSLGITGQVRPPCNDPDEAYFEPGSITRQIHSDLPVMLIGGVAALLFQMLHPLAMAGVAEFSNYRQDPLGRLERTASFLGTTTFSSRPEAEVAIARVRSVHALVEGTAPDGRPYAAGDPALITWVHAAEVRSFLNAALAYGPRPLKADEQDRYVDEMARVALALGAEEVPRSTAELDAYFDAVRPELRLTREARVARNFILRGVGRWPHEITTYGLLVVAAQGVLPPWARRQLHLARLPAGDRLAVRPAARAFATALRWVAAPPPAAATPTDPGAAVELTVAR